MDAITDSATKYLRGITPPVLATKGGESSVHIEHFTNLASNMASKKLADMLLTANFQPAKLNAPTRGVWRVMWYNLNPTTGKLERVRKTFNLNRVADLKERRRVGKLFVQVINRALGAGWNYFTHFLKIPTAELLPGAELHSIEFVALKMLDIRITGMKKRTIDSYRSYTNVFCDWLRLQGYNRLPSNEFTHAHWFEFIKYKGAAGAGNGNINDYICYFKTTFKKAKPLGYIDNNPLDGIDYLPEKESALFTEITPDELALIGPALIAENPLYYIYTKFTSHEYVRPYHITFIKAGDIDYSRDVLRTYDKSAKNNRVNEKQLLPEMKKILMDNGYHLLPANWYLFGKGFKPSPTSFERLSKDSADLWRRIVIDGLGINKKMYALKHTSGTHYINANKVIDTAWLSKQMEHSNLSQTETYIKNRTKKNINTKGVNLIKY